VKSFFHHRFVSQERNDVSMKKYWIILLIIILFTLGFIGGIYVYQKNKTQDSNIVEKTKLATNVVVQKEPTKEVNIISTSTKEETVSPNATILKKEYYKGCDHLVRDLSDVSEMLVNKTKSEVENYYPEWEVDSFSNSEITIYQEKEGFCPQHYLIKEHNGVLGIYTIAQNGTITFKQDTQIQTMYLPEVDLQRVREGIEAIGDTQLNTVLEDFE